MKIKPMVPTTLQECKDLAKIYWAIAHIRSQYKGPEEVFFVITLSLELGLTPAQGIQNIYLRNGKPCMWGDSLLAIVLGSGLLVEHKEYYAGDPSTEDQSEFVMNDKLTAFCEVKRNGMEKRVNTFSVSDAKRAKLWIYKPGSQSKLPWQTYPKRMLMMRARTFVLRDTFADVLKGLTSREEVDDYKDLSAKANKKIKVDEKKEEDNYFWSKKLEIRYLVTNNGEIYTEDGVRYTKKDIDDFEKMSKEEAIEEHFRRVVDLNGNDATVDN